MVGVGVEVSLAYVDDTSDATVGVETSPSEMDTDGVSVTSIIE